jgi:hypothetical protein
VAINPRNTVKKKALLNSFIVGILSLLIQNILELVDLVRVIITDRIGRIKIITDNCLQVTFPSVNSAIDINDNEKLT